MNALLARDHLLHPDDPEHPDDNRQERIDARVQELLADRDAVEAADEAYAGTLDYDGLETALADLWTKEPGAIFSSNAWSRLMTLAHQAHTERMAKLADMAAEDVAEAAAFRPDMEDAA